MTDPELKAILDKMPNSLIIIATLDNLDATVLNNVDGLQAFDIGRLFGISSKAIEGAGEQVIRKLASRRTVDAAAFLKGYLQVVKGNKTQWARSEFHDK